MIQRSITSLCLNLDRRLFGGGFCLFPVYLIVRKNSSRNIIIEMHLSGQLINNHFDRHCLHWIIDLFREVSVLSVYSYS